MRIATGTLGILLLFASCSSQQSPEPANREEPKKPAPKEEPPQKQAPTAVAAGDGSILRLDPTVDELIPRDAKIEKVATGFQFTEGPLWFPEQKFLWFTDVAGSVIRQITAEGTVTDVLKPSAAANGLTFDKNGNVLICQHEARRVARRNRAGVITTLVDRFQGKRLNSPNDIVAKADGSLYFTDPPYGLSQQDEDPKKELDFNGVFRLQGGRMTLLTRDLTRPNGLAFSPDETTLYVANSDAARKIWMKFPVEADGTLGNGRVFADVTAEREDGLPDGMKVDAKGNVWGTGPGGVWIFDPSGKHLGTIKPTEVPANVAFAEDGAVLWMTAHTSVYRIRLRPEAATQ